MSKWGQGVVTNKGLELIAESQIGNPLTITKVSLGEGNLGTTDPATLTRLIAEVLSVSIIEAKELTPGVFQVRSDISPQDIPKDFWWREVGIFAKGGDGVETLYAYNFAGNNASYIVAGGTDTLTLQFPVSVGNAANATILVDEAAAYVLLRAYEEKLEQVDADVATALSYVAYLFQISIPVSSWTLSGSQYTATMAAPGLLLGDYIYTVSATPETMRVSAEAGGVLMLTPTVAGQATFTVPDIPSGPVVMVLKREVARDG